MACPQLSLSPYEAVSRSAGQTGLANADRGAGEGAGVGVKRFGGITN